MRAGIDRQGYGGPTCDVSQIQAKMGEEDLSDEEEFPGFPKIRRYFTFGKILEK